MKYSIQKDAYNLISNKSSTNVIDKHIQIYTSQHIKIETDYKSITHTYLFIIALRINSVSNKIKIGPHIVCISMMLLLIMLLLSYVLLS